MSDTTGDRKRVVFVCVENSNRSQMAEAFAHIHGAGRVEAFSAGSRPSGRINPKAVEAMREVGYDLTTHTSKGWTTSTVRSSRPPSRWAVATNARSSWPSGGWTGKYPTRRTCRPISSRRT